MKAYPSSNESIPTGFYTLNESIPQNKSHISELKEHHMCHFFEIETVDKAYFLLSVDFFSGGYKF